MTSFRSTSPALFEGRALAIVKSTDTDGTVSLTVTSDGLAPQTIQIKTSKNGEATIIDNLPAPAPQRPAGIYDMTGRRLQTIAGHGLFIVDGKKIIR